jgi:hypothetical protein
MRRLLIAAAALAALVRSAPAADISVSYTVDDKALRAAITGTQLIFALYKDSACTISAGGLVDVIDNVALIERLKRFKPLGGAKPPNTARLVHVIPGVTPPPTLYLQVGGTGIVPVGGSCQLQYSSVAGANLPCATQVGNEVYFTGCNVNVRNGSGTTTSANAVGNLVIGYNQNSQGYARGGSHNLIVGDDHGYSLYGSSVSGFRNRVTGAYSSVNGGSLNLASGFGTSVNGGENNVASGDRSSASGGQGNTASGAFASVSGGQSNTASGQSTAVSGGLTNVASAVFGSVSGGLGNLAGTGTPPFPGFVATWAPSVSGGYRNNASGAGASVSGGGTNTASGDTASVGGGLSRSSTGTDDWRAGSLFEDN